jgi:AraC-like DNA-binding protein
VRRLHPLFEPSGESFAQYVLRRRLEECRAALTSPIGERSIADGTFYRTFRRAFGATPAELRAQAEGLSPRAGDRGRRSQRPRPQSGVLR